MNVRNVDEKSSLQVIVNPRTHATSAVYMEYNAQGRRLRPRSLLRAVCARARGYTPVHYLYSMWLGWAN